MFAHDKTVFIVQFLKTLVAASLVFVFMFCCTGESCLAQTLITNSSTATKPTVLFEDRYQDPHDWLLQGNVFAFALVDGNSGNIVTRVASETPRSMSFTIGVDGVIGFGVLHPTTLMDIRAINDASSCKIGVGEFSDPSLALFEETKTSELLLETGGVGQFSLLTMATPSHQFSFKLNDNQDKFVIRDEINGKNAITIFPNILNNNIITIRNGNLGVARGNPQFPLHMQSGARCTAGGVWTNASSRSLKQEIKTLDGTLAADVFDSLRPVTYRYKADAREQHVGFIAEDVPELVATIDRKGLAAMDLVAVITKVVQQQRVQIEGQDEEIKLLQTDLKAIKLQHDQQINQLATELALLRQSITNQ